MLTLWPTTLYPKALQYTSQNRTKRTTTVMQHVHFSCKPFAIAGPTAWNSLPVLSRIQMLMKPISSICKRCSCSYCTSTMNALGSFYILCFYVLYKSRTDIDAGTQPMSLLEMLILQPFITGRNSGCLNIVKDSKRSRMARCKPVQIGAQQW